MMYLMYETQKRMLNPMASYLNHVIQWADFYEKNYNQYNIFGQNHFINLIQAKSKFVYQFVKEYTKPAFNINEVIAEGVTYEITEEVVLDKTFCELRHFVRTPEAKKKVPLLVVAPLSGHYATLLRDTVKSSIKDFEVYVTDWKNCRDIPLSEGDFGFEDYVLYVQEFIETLKEQYGEVHIIAVCQPTVPVLTAVAKMAHEKSDLQADSMTLMGGPIDTRESPTEVNKYASKNDLSWFENNVVYSVPIYYPGVNRRVYPGFLQYSGFVSMNFKKHTQANIDFFNNLLKGADLNAKKHEDFYEEYNAVMDLPAKYYLETIENIFLDQKLAKGTLEIAGEKISLKDIRKTRLFTIEGELDDISGPGQTHSAIKLCSNIKDKQSKTFENVGHYGVFAGRSWRNVIYPEIRDFILKK